MAARPSTLLSCHQPDRGGQLAHPGIEGRGIIEFAWAQRSYLVRTGKSHLSADDVRMPMMRLRKWLDSHLVPSVATLSDFWASHEADLRIVMPSKARKNKLQRFQSLLHNEL